MDVEIIRIAPEEVRLGTRCSGDCFIVQKDLYITTDRLGENRVDCVRLESGSILSLDIDLMIIPMCAKAVVTY